MKLRSLREKLFFAFGIILVFSVFLAGLGYYSLNRNLYYTNLIGQMDNIELSVQSLIILEKEFLLHEAQDKTFHQTRQSQNLNGIKQKIKLIKQTLHKLQNEKFIKSANLSFTIKQLSTKLSELEQLFQILVNKHLQKGFKDWGMNGFLRQQIHQVENSKVSYDKITLLTLRRYEKDFMLRKDTFYVQKFKQLMNRFQKQLFQISDNQLIKDSLIKQTENYQNAFLQVVTLENEIGLSENDGIQGGLQKNKTSINHNLLTINNLLKKQIQEASDAVIFTFLLMFGLQFIFILYFGVGFINRLSKRITHLNQSILQLANGNLLKPFESKQKDELGHTFEALNRLNQRIEIATQFALAVGEGKSNLHYENSYSTGVLEKALLKMQKNLSELELEKFKNNWVNAGLAKFMDILNDHNVALKLLCQKILFGLVDYMEVQQGGFFVYLADSEPSELQLISSYAQQKSVLLNKKVLVGEGLVGQTFANRKTMLVKDIPQNYAIIKSGLGQTNPKNLLLVPIKNQMQIFGVIELASLNEFDDYQIHFLEKIAENIAYVVQNYQMDVMV